MQFEENSKQRCAEFIVCVRVPRCKEEKKMFCDMFCDMFCSACPCLSFSLILIVRVVNRGTYCVGLLQTAGINTVQYQTHRDVKLSDIPNGIELPDKILHQQTILVQQRRSKYSVDRGQRGSFDDGCTL